MAGIQGLGIARFHCNCHFKVILRVIHNMMLMQLLIHTHDRCKGPYVNFAYKINVVASIIL